MASTDDIVTRPARRDVRMDGVFFYRSVAGSSFNRALEAGNFSYCVAVRVGKLRLEIDFPSTKTIALGPGDVVAVSGLAAHAFKSQRLGDAAPVMCFERLSMGAKHGTGEVELVIGAVPNESLALGSLMVGPIVVRPAEYPILARRLWRAIEMLEDEYANSPWLDQTLVIRRLAEIMLVNMTRRLFADRTGPQAEPRQPASRQIVQAINAFFASPERPWNLQQLAKAAGMSRSRFAEEFKLVTGQTPGKIVARMKLTAIARRLTMEGMSVEEAAETAGYSSSAAFVRAFQREFGETPARWRRERGAADPITDRAARRRQPLRRTRREAR